MSVSLINLASDQPRLIDAAASGDVIALQALLHMHRERLLAYIRKHLPPGIRSAVDVEDVFQETCIETFRHIRSFIPAEGNDDSFARWLLTIARNYMAASLRKTLAIKRGAGRQLEIGYDPDDSGIVISMLQTLAVYRRTPSTSAAAHELAAKLEMSIGRLPPDWGRAVKLRHVDGLAAKDAAAQMARTEGAFHQLCHRALCQLREELKSLSFYV